MLRALLRATILIGGNLGALLFAAGAIFTLSKDSGILWTIVLGLAAFACLGIVANMDAKLFRGGRPYGLSQGLRKSASSPPNDDDMKQDKP